MFISKDVSWIVFLCNKVVSRYMTSTITVTLVRRSARVATVKEKVLENEIFSRSGKSQGITFSVREILKK